MLIVYSFLKLIERERERERRLGVALIILLCVHVGNFDPAIGSY